MKRTITVTWETDGYEANLPSVVKIPAWIEDEQVSDYLSDSYGYLVMAWC